LPSGGLGQSGGQRRPIPGQQFAEPIDFVIVDAGQNVGEIGLRVEAPKFDSKSTK
jgi:hypothetical protein